MVRTDFTRSLWFLVLVTPATYLVLVAAGRWLKRRAGVPLGLLYQAFCLAVAFLVPLSFRDTPAALMQLLGSAVAVLGTIFALGLVRRFVWEYYCRERRQTIVPKYVQDVVALVAFVLVLIFVLTAIYEVRIPGLLAGSGIIAVILGLAMQDTLGNIFAGLSLHFGKPFRPGDWLLIDNRQAEVIEINWRSTRLRTNDHVYLDIPNSHISKQTIINLNYPDRLHAMRLAVGIDYRVPPNEIKEALLHATTQAMGVLAQPPPRIYLGAFAESAITYEIKFWLEDDSRVNDITDGIRTNIWYELRRRQIQIPFPIRTVHLETGAPFSMPIERPDRVRDLLRAQTLFHCLDDAQRDALEARARPLRFGRGERIIEQGTEGDSMFLLVCGEAAVSVQHNGEVTRVAALRAGDCFGEMSLLTGARRSATVIARTDCDVLEIEKAVMAELLEGHPELLVRLSELLARRQVETEGLLEENTQVAQRQSVIQRQRECAAGFLSKIAHFFEL
jgi:small-conductance mechanosensitive channel/CRP-like cAMP-binding protein